MFTHTDSWTSLGTSSRDTEVSTSCLDAHVGLLSGKLMMSESDSCQFHCSEMDGIPWVPWKTSGKGNAIYNIGVGAFLYFRPFLVPTNQFWAWLRSSAQALCSGSCHAHNKTINCCWELGFSPLQHSTFNVQPPQILWKVQSYAPHPDVLSSGIHWSRCNWMALLSPLAGS